jgi:hypothetical protein
MDQIFKYFVKAQEYCKCRKLNKLKFYYVPSYDTDASIIDNETQKQYIYIYIYIKYIYIYN